MENAIPYFIIAAGLFAAAGGGFGWAWFMSSRRARIWVKLFGLGGARVFYVILGLALATFGGVTATGALE